MPEPTDDSIWVSEILRRMTLMSVICFLISYIGENRGICFAGGMAGAIVISWIAAGTSMWAAVRIGRRRIIYASIFALTVAIAATIRWYFAIFNQ